MSIDDCIPHGFKRLADWDFRQREKGDGHSPEYKLLIAAVKAGRIRGIQTCGGRGRLYVDEQQARAFLDKHKEPVAPHDPKPARAKPTDAICDTKTEAAVIALCEINNGISLIHATLERLAAALESMATQPKAEPEYVSHYATTSSNGIHQ